eukprot:TRINITY_DN2933_c0_g4_i7.p1 TRINITY_DN2933_c0_g4~~TRINITY_DN2933_c0_g4_i7.p1  ORF type:complete len:184 (-),score=61.54 TRINITY_DN2933_c0_g4_i7:135-665(-)
MIRRPPRSTRKESSAASDVYKRQSSFCVKFHGPKDSPYEGGVWKVNVFLPDQYPYKSPSIGFSNRIFHPNIDERSGTVCLDVINQAWSPMFDLINIFESFLPQLLIYPNSEDPLNPEAATLQMKFPDTYKKKVKEYVEKYAKEGVKIDNNVQANLKNEEKKEEEDDLSVTSQLDNE